MEDKENNPKGNSTDADQEILEPDAEYISHPPFDDGGADAGWSADGFSSAKAAASGSSDLKEDVKAGSEAEASGPQSGSEQNDKAPTEAASIRYDEGSPAPILSEIGSGERAEAIVEMAKELGVYIHRDERLLSELKRLREGEEIPKELYAVIAAILSFSYILQGKTPETYKRQDGTTAVNTKA
jgi:flagellar biosynthesis protein